MFVLTERFTLFVLLLLQVECAVQLAEQGCMEGPHAVQGLASSMHLVERALGPGHPLLAHILLHRARLLRQHQQYHQVGRLLPAVPFLIFDVSPSFFCGDCTVPRMAATPQDK